MPAPIGPLLGFSLGALFAWAAVPSPGESASHRGPGRSTWIVGAFALLVFAPIGAFFIGFARAWSYFYLVPSNAFSGLLDMGLVILDALSVPLGFSAAMSPAGRRQFSKWLWWVGVPLFVTALILAAGLPRLGVVGSYAQFRGGFGTESLAGSQLGYAILWMGTVLTLATWWIVRCLRRPETVSDSS